MSVNPIITAIRMPKSLEKCIGNAIKAGKGITTKGASQFVLDHDVFTPSTTKGAIEKIAPMDVTETIFKPGKMSPIETARKPLTTAPKNSEESYIYTLAV